jgi:hypothetical protein
MTTRAPHTVARVGAGFKPARRRGNHRRIPNGLAGRSTLYLPRQKVFFVGARHSVRRAECPDPVGMPGTHAWHCATHRHAPSSQGLDVAPRPARRSASGPFYPEARRATRHSSLGFSGAPPSRFEGGLACYPGWRQPTRSFGRRTACAPFASAVAGPCPAHMLGVTPPIRTLSSRAESRGFSLPAFFAGAGRREGSAVASPLCSFLVFCKMQTQLSASEGCNVARSSLRGARLLVRARLQPCRECHDISSGL